MVNTQSLPELSVPVLGVQQPGRADSSMRATTGRARNR